MDAIALVQHFGKPDIIFTMTYNPSWPEIKEHLLATDETQNRPDLVSQVFRAKEEEMKTYILKRNIFGKVAAFMYIVEFQKRGLSHAHFLIMLTDDYKLLTPEAYDKFFSDELPDPDANSYLPKLVIKYMIKQSSLACLIRDAKLIVWDEVSIAKKNMTEALDPLLKDLMDTHMLFGGNVIIFGGDFRQTLPVIRSGKKEDFIREIILNSEIWNYLEKIRLSKNMRAKTDPSFCEHLMQIGNGKEKTNMDNKNCVTKNDFVDELNDVIIAQFLKDARIFVTTDETVEPSDQSQFEDFLHSLNLAGLPLYKLTLKENCYKR
uniref:ATP-dependent DNA helicase n=1 Tax=Nicotiana tabacum TaxID=4097 RepID=A0A1S3X819_TOBAC|nr:PREDICTED: uncharacterized protein LOC107762085 [Nicotiana tabacum]